MSLLLVVLALIVVVTVAVFMVGPSGRLPDAEHDREPADLPTDRLVQPVDIDRLRFSSELRGYRMDQVDAVLDQVSRDVGGLTAHRDALAAQLRDAGLEPVDAPVAEVAVATPVDDALLPESDDELTNVSGDESRA